MNMRLSRLSYFMNLNRFRVHKMLNTEQAKVEGQLEQLKSVYGLLRMGVSCVQFAILET